jgi:DNA invertase Pin-like site-specific DNA recombinase
MPLQHSQRALAVLSKGQGNGGTEHRQLYRLLLRLDAAARSKWSWPGSAQNAVRNYLNGDDWRIVGEFKEIESGKRKDRPKLVDALAACRVHGAKLIIAKPDRRARNVAFVSTLMEAGVEFEAVDFPQANRLTIHLLAAFAEHEARAISDRTKAALAAAKRRGVKLGGYRAGAKLTAKARQAGWEAGAERANKKAAETVAGSFLN